MLLNDSYLLSLQSFTSEFIYAEPLEVFPDSDEEICDVDDDPGTNDIPFLETERILSHVTWSH